MTDRIPKHAHRSTTIEQDSSTPRYYQLQEIIRELCASLEPGQPIPPELDLCQMYNVSRTTVRKALDHLTQEGLLYRIHGKGTFVSPPKLRERFVNQCLGFYEDMMSRGVEVRTRVLEQAVIPASKLIAPSLQLAVGSPVIKLVRVRSVGGEPILVSTSVLPYRLFPSLISENLTDTSLYLVLREKYGVQLNYGTRLVETAPCTEEDAELLQIPLATPLLIVSGIMYDSENRPIDCGYSRHRGDRSQVEIEVVAR
jgi:GntR family transcriptional regulator